MKAGASTTKKWPSNREFWRRAQLRAQGQLDEMIRRVGVQSPVANLHDYDATGGYHQLFSPMELNFAISELSSRDGDSRRALERIYATLTATGPWRPLARAPKPEAIEALSESFPHFAAVIDFMSTQMSLCLLGTSPGADAVPVLLTGDPGVGKSAFAKALASTIGTGFEELSLGGSTAGFTITGLDAGWAGGRPGRIFQCLAWNGYANPVVLLDEIDKAGGSDRYDVANCLLSLLERHTACRFVDEHAQISIDASRVLWFATSNDESMIPGPVRSRFKIFHIGAPSPDQGRRIALSIYRSLRSQASWGFRFEHELREEVATAIASATPRRQRQVLLEALGRAAREGRSFVQPDDLATERPSRNRAGFT